jgi:hypothetical protein
MGPKFLNKKWGKKQGEKQKQKVKKQTICGMEIEEKEDPEFWRGHLGLKHRLLSLAVTTDDTRADLTVFLSHHLHDRTVAQHRQIFHPRMKVS